ncbi:SPOR domain-containing protein [Clostridia bacterium OttesenSCG-928-F22]|nr:SPOR domain-containing protein [Clostridia bacterium OttesenSCG-928-F22]
MNRRPNRRRRNTGRRRSASRSSSPAGSRTSRYAKVILAVVLIGGAMYFLTAGAAGKWVADNIVTPIISLFEPSPSGTIAPTPSPSPSASSKAQTEENVKIDGRVCYMVQAGVFLNKENAMTAASEVRTLGGAGYVYEDDTRYRVLAAAYGAEQDAKAVIANIAQAHAIETAVFKLEIGELDMNITATVKQRECITEAFAQHNSACSQLGAIISALDSGSKPLSTCKTELGTLKEALNKARTALKDSDSNTVVLGLEELMISFEKQLDTLIGDTGTDNTLFSSKMKEAHMQAIFGYAQYIDTLTKQ